MIEDEIHIVYYCPLYQTLRDDVPLIFKNSVKNVNSLKRLMTTNEHVFLFARFIYHVFRVRGECL